MTDKQIPNERRQYEYKSVYPEKSIIIDGVDVSGCVQFIQEEKDCCDLGGNCKGWTNCYYKQLKRKEQECEELKKGYAELTDIVAPYMDDFTGYNEELGGFDIVLCVKQLMEQLDQLKAENDELKRENELAKQLINWILKFFELTDYDWQYDQNEISFLIEDCMDDKQSTIDFVTDINKELLTKLTEIKEIAEHCMKQDICTTCDNSDKCYIEDEEIPTYDVCKLILQKISECEVENE